MKQAILVFIGGGFGSVARYFIGKILNNSTSGIPYGTLVANVLGSLFIGIILGLAIKNNTFSQNQTLLLATGFCGGFTTFSTFAYENVGLLKSGDFLNFFIYTIVTFVIGLGAVFSGLYLTKTVF
ncbi:fluoride efflux transporter CrcB [Urechidicola croceus]|uniref:Fluoride-specific ion channel FluC n=1 Tax=Urechidicola croceus TaxID=1850246 RepID=A0A1D8P748_9FLAO|nr:fluoride efflux transporter CrcB [Urechidicola croceus]AOW20397.1 protein CrcB [Urechidicola croceus]